MAYQIADLWMIYDDLPIILMEIIHFATLNHKRVSSKFLLLKFHSIPLYKFRQSLSFPLNLCVIQLVNLRFCWWIVHQIVNSSYSIVRIVGKYNPIKLNITPMVNVYNIYPIFNPI